MRKVFEFESSTTGELVSIISDSPVNAFAELRESDYVKEWYDPYEEFTIESESDFRYWLNWSDIKFIQNEVSLSERIYARTVKLQYRLSSLKRRFVKAIMPSVNDAYFNVGEEDIII